LCAFLSKANQTWNWKIRKVAVSASSVRRQEMMTGTTCLFEFLPASMTLYNAMLARGPRCYSPFRLRPEKMRRKLTQA